MVGIFFYSYIMILTTSPRIQIRFGDIDIIWHLSKILRFKIQLWTRFIILQILMSQFYVLLFWLLKLYNISSSDFIVHWVSCYHKNRCPKRNIRNHNGYITIQAKMPPPNVRRYRTRNFFILQKNCKVFIILYNVGI